MGAPRARRRRRGRGGAPTFGALRRKLSEAEATQRVLPDEQLRRAIAVAASLADAVDARAAAAERVRGQRGLCVRYLSDQICVWTWTGGAARDACGAPWRSNLAAAGDSVSQLALLTGLQGSQTR